MATEAKLNLEIRAFSRPGRCWIRVTASGVQAGKYGSIVSAGFDTSEGDPPRDAEELVSMVLANLGSIAYG